MRSPATAPALWLTFIPDGRVLLELRAGYRTVRANAEAHVDETEAMAGIVREWAALPLDAAPSRERGDFSPEYRQGYLVIVQQDPTPELWRFTDGPGALVERFGRVFGDDGPPSPADIDALASGIASDAWRFHRRAQQKARERLAGGDYLRVLESYVQQLRDVEREEDQDHYETARHGIGAIAQDEMYLRLAEDPRARELHLAIEQQMSELYNWHQDLAHGGNERARR